MRRDLAIVGVAAMGYPDDTAASGYRFHRAGLCRADTYRGPEAKRFGQRILSPMAHWGPGIRRAKTRLQTD
jgi:hypothetical protein